ncbi:MAG: TRM11 family methyltransferase [Saprospiraceae bacterium]
MTVKKSNLKYIYSFNYDRHNIELCKLESRQLFEEEEKDKLLFSNIKIDPSVSSFIKNRFEIILFADNYSEVLKKIKQENIHAEEFKVEYLILDGDEMPYKERLQKLRDIEYNIERESNYHTPTINYSVCNYNNVWYFGTLIKKNTDWLKHKKKPYSFSNSLNIDIAKTLVTVVSKGNKTIKLLDACCGVGTVMLEACYAGFIIEGCDINWKACKHTRLNLAHYNYTAEVYRSDIKDLNLKYDAAIIDLPYNLYAYSDDLIISNIIESTAKLTDRIAIVSISDISNLISDIGFSVTDYCNVGKSGKGNFARKIWVCDKVSKVPINTESMNSK